MPVILYMGKLVLGYKKVIYKLRTKGCNSAKNLPDILWGKPENTLWHKIQYSRVGSTRV